MLNLRAAAAGDFVVALYNPVSARRRTALPAAREILLASRPGGTPVVLARNLGRPGEHVSLTTLDALDVEGLGALWARLRGAPAPDHVLDLSERAPTPPPLGKGEAEPDVPEWERFVDAYLARYAAEGT